MTKEIITFSAIQQTLIKTGGIDCFAGETVEYVEAQFDLGENWSGYDHIDAIWTNDGNFAQIATVLSPEGICRVPTEVLKSIGEVRVNLVGTTTEDDQITERLTTYPIFALGVNANVPVSGSETAEITPSQFDQFVDIVIAEVEKVTGMTAEAVTLPPGSDATAIYADGILTLGIPQGIQGERGETGADGADGNGIASVVYNADYSLTLIFDNGEQFTTPPIRGERGPAGADGRDGTDGADGVTPNLSIGNVTTLEPSEDAYVTRRGTDANPIFDFGIPKGDTGTVPDLDLILPTDTASGDIASIPDGQSVVPVKSLKVTLEPIQSGSGDPSPSNIRPISGHTECVTWDDPVYGGTIEWNQLVPSDAPSSSAVTNNGDGSFTAIAGANEYYIIGRFNVEQGHKYLASCRGGDATSCYLRVDGADGNPWIGEASSAHIYTAGFSGEQKPIYIRTLQPSQNITVVPQLSDLTQMFGAGNEPTTVDEFKALFPLDYYAYNAGETTCVSAVNGNPYYTYTTTLGRTVYGGTLDVVSGELVVEAIKAKASDCNISLGGTSDSTKKRAYFYRLPNAVKNIDPTLVDGLMRCNVFEATTANRTYTKVEGISVSNNSNGVYAYKDDLQTVADWQTFIEANDMEFTYTLATPQTYQLDPQTISLLHGNNNVWSDGSVELTYNADVQLWVLKQLGTSGTSTLSMTRTLAKSEDADTKTDISDTKSDAELTKSDNIQLAED